MMRDQANGMYKRLTAAALVLLLLMTMLPASAFAASGAYEGQQGNNPWITMQDSSNVSVSDITTDADTEAYASNTIGTKLDSGEVIRFRAMVSGASTQSPTEEQIRQNTMPHIKVYYEGDALSQENPVAAYDGGSGALSLEKVRWTGSSGSEGATQTDGYAILDLAVAAETLSPDTTYALVFEKDLSVKRTDSTIGKDIVFYFTTETSASGLALSNTKITTSIGQTEKLTATYDGSPVQASWSSDKQSVATVDADGTVHAVSEGTATITCEYQGESIVCNVTVGSVLYGMQGIGGNQFAMIQPDDITVLSETDERYMNRINTKFHDDEDVVFVVKMSAGMQQFDEAGFVRDKLPLIKVYDTYQGTVVAQSSPEEGQAELEYGGYDAETGITLKIRQGALERGSYCLVVGKNLAGNAPDKILGKDVVFQFKITDPQETIEVESVSLDWENVTLAAGAKLQLDATVTPQDATDPSLSWKSSESGIAQVDENGQITAVSKGSAVITAEAVKGKGSDSCQVTVVENQLELSDLSLSLSLNQEQTLRAAADGETVEAQWESDAPEVVSVDAEGTVKALASGHATITVRYQGKTAVCVVTVHSKGTYGYQGVGGNTMLLKSPDNLYVKDATSTDYYNGINTKIDGSQDVVFEFTMSAGMNNFTESKFLQYSMPYIRIYNEDKSEVVAEYDGGNGKLKFLGVNYSDEESNHDGYKAQGLYIGVDAEVLENGNYVLVFGKQVCGNNINKILGRDVNFSFTVEWSAETVRIGLSEESDSLASAVADRLSKYQSPEEIRKLIVETDGYTLTEADFAYIRDTLGGTLENLDLRQAALPENELPAGALKDCGALKELSLPASLSVLREDALSGCGALTTLRLTGETPPRVEDASMLDTTALETVMVPSEYVDAYRAAEPWKNYLLYIEVESVRLNREKLTISEGSSEILTATVSPANASEQGVTWSSSREEVATVDENGTIQALKVGQTTITVTTKDGELQASCEVTVQTPPPVITLSQEQAEIWSSGSGNTLRLTAEVSNTELWTSEDVYWSSSNPEVADVERFEGLVTGKSAGVAAITARVDDQSSICIVIVKNHTIKLDKSSASLYAAGSGSTSTLRAYIDGKLVSGRQATWTSSNSSVATVSASGIVTGKNAGTTVITAEANGKTAKCTVTVKAATIRLNRTGATLYTRKNTSLLLTATVNGARVSGSRVSWTSSNARVASVSGSGVVTAKRKGTVTITARANGKTATCRVTVKKPTLRLVKKSAKIRRGKKVRIRVKATPKGKVTYKSKNKKVATVNKKGVVRGKKKGKARIQVKCNGVTKTFTVRVR